MALCREQLPSTLTVIWKVQFCRAMDINNNDWKNLLFVLGCRIKISRCVRPWNEQDRKPIARTDLEGQEKHSQGPRSRSKYARSPHPPPHGQLKALYDTSPRTVQCGHLCSLKKGND